MCSFATNICLSGVKIVSGILGASGALIADGIHSLSDMVTDVFSMLGHKLSTKPADEKHPFGHGKMEYITCIVIGIIVAVMGVSIIYNAFTEKRSIPSLFAALVGLIVIFAKIILSKFLLKKGKEYESNILIASGSESFSDVISSVVVLVSILISQLGKINSVFVYADMVAMIIVGILILRIAYNIFKDNFSGLLGEQVTDKVYMENLKKVILSEKDVKKIDTLIVLKYGRVYQVTSEVHMDGNMTLKNAHDVLDRIEEKLKKYDFRIKHITLHAEPND